jgi:hypothetical protein
MAKMKSARCFDCFGNRGKSQSQIVKITMAQFVKLLILVLLFARVSLFTSSSALLRDTNGGMEISGVDMYNSEEGAIWQVTYISLGDKEISR